MSEPYYYDPTKLSPSDTYGSTSTTEDPPQSPLDFGIRPSAGWDYVLVFSAPSSTSSPPTPKQRRIDAARLAVLEDLREASFSYSQLWVPSSANILVRIALPESEMMRKAEHAPLKFRTRPEYSGGYIGFSRVRACVFENYNRKLRGLPFFTPAERLFITQATLRSNEEWGGDIDLADLFRDGVLKQAFALHSRHEKNLLISACVKDSWKRPFSGLPLYALQEYLGPRITLYLAWILFYTRMITGIAIFGTILFIIIALWGTTQVQAFCRLSFGIAVAFWSSYWSRYWQRRNAVLNVRWGVTESDSDRENVLREGFDGPEIPGFYSQGGFVHLSDLAEQNQEALNEGNDEENAPIDRSLQISSIPPPLPAHANDGVDDEVMRFVDDTEDEHVISEDIGDENQDADPFSEVRIKQSERTTLTSLVSHETSSDERVVIFGGDDDMDFTVSAPITGRTFEELPVFPFISRKTVIGRMRISAMVTIVVAAFVGTISFLILFFGPEINTFLGVERGSNVITGVLTACLIIISDTIWKNISTDLTKWENHHTTQRHEDSLIMKRFAFQFVSNYLSLFYIAFVKPFTSSNPCMLNASGAPDCMLELQTQLMSVVITKATIEQIVELIMPNFLALVLRLTAANKQKELDSAISSNPEELDRLKDIGAVIDKTAIGNIDPSSYLSKECADADALPSNDTKAAINEQRRIPYDGTIDDYAEIIIQFGYLVLFGVAFPPAAAIHLLNNLIEIRTDTYKILAFHRRPPVDIAKNIGRWQNIVNFLSNLSVVTIVAVLTITTPDLVVVLDTVLPDNIVQQLTDQPLICFVIAEHILFFVRWIVTSYIPEAPGSTYRLRARRSFLLARCLDIGWRPYFRGRRLNQSYQTWRRNQT